MQGCWGAPTDPNSVGVIISCVKAIFTESVYGFIHFLTSTMPINPITIIWSNKIKLANMYRPSFGYFFHPHLNTVWGKNSEPSTPLVAAGNNQICASLSVSCYHSGKYLQNIKKAQCVSILFLPVSHRLLAVPVTLMFFSCVAQAGILIPPFQAAIDILKWVYIRIMCTCCVQFVPVPKCHIIHHWRAVIHCCCVVYFSFCTFTCRFRYPKNDLTLQ